MKEILDLIKKSKTAKSGIVTIIWGVLILFGITTGPPPKTIDEMGQEQSNPIEKIIGVGGVALGALTLKGRNDVEKKVKELER